MSSIRWYQRNHQYYIPTVVLPHKVFTFMSNKSVKFSGHNTPLNAYILEVAQAVRDEVAEASGSEHSEHAERSDHSEHSASAHTPTPPLASPQLVESSERTASLPVSRENPISVESTSPHLVSKEGTSLQGTASEHTTPLSPNDYTSTGGFQTPGGDEGGKGFGKTLRV
jgi:hypothetical protein